MPNASPEELRDQAIATAARRHAAAIRNNCAAGHAQTLETLTDALAHRMSMPGMTETLIRTSMACGPNTTGAFLIDLVQKCVDDEAELAAIKDVERMEADGRDEAFHDRISRRVMDRAMAQLPELTVAA